jgi:hypothetical protein
MAILDRVKVNPNICAVEVAFTGDLTAANIPDWQQFNNSLMTGLDLTKIYVGLGSVSFGEESEYSLSGTSYKQSVTIRFPSTDLNRSQRIELLQRVKFLKLKLTNGLDIIIGRNDYQQNARPKIKTETNIKTAEAKFQTVSMFSAGFVSNPDAYGLPTLIPISLY